MAESEIPDEILAAANRIVDVVIKPFSGSEWNAARTAIAEALLSERRQCADIAYDAALYSGCPADFIAEEIAEAVRNGRQS